MHEICDKIFPSRLRIEFLDIIYTSISFATGEKILHVEIISRKVEYVCVCFPPIHSGHQVRWTYQPGSHRRKVTQDFSSTFFLRCVP